MNPNPKNINDLDPNLRETYERVMGAAYNSNGQSQPQANAPTSQPVLTPIEEPANSPLQPSQLFNNAPRPAASTPDVLSGAQVEVNRERKKKFVPVAIGVVALIFFVAYGVIWAKVFGLF